MGNAETLSAKALSVQSWRHWKVQSWSFFFCFEGVYGAFHSFEDDFVVQGPLGLYRAR